MLRAARALVAHRALRLGGPRVDRYGVSARAAPALCGAPALAPAPPLPRLGLGVPRRRLLRAPAPPPALRTRRGLLSAASVRVRSSGERAAEVRPTLCCACLSARLTKAPVMSQPLQAVAPFTVWVKRTDVAGARYDFIKNVDPEQLVAELIARWVAQEKLDVGPSLVTLRLVKCSGPEPTPGEESEAKVLSPRLKLADAGVTDGCSLLAFVAGALEPCFACLLFVALRRALNSRLRFLQVQPLA
jgi:hypothetical protein